MIISLLIRRGLRKKKTQKKKRKAQTLKEGSGILDPRLIKMMKIMLFKKKKNQIKAGIKCFSCSLFS